MLNECDEIASLMQSNSILKFVWEKNYWNWVIWVKGLRNKDWCKNEKL